MTVGNINICTIINYIDFIVAITSSNTVYTNTKDAMKIKIDTYLGFY